MEPTKCYCKGCGQRILYMKTAANKIMPVDYKPELDNVNIDKFDPKTMTSHFATCSKADQFRKKKSDANGNGK